MLCERGLNDIENWFEQVTLYVPEYNTVQINLYNMCTGEYSLRVLIEKSLSVMSLSGHDTRSNTH